VVEMVIDCFYHESFENQTVWVCHNMKVAQRPQISGVAFLLAQLGAHVGDRFSQRIADLGLTPAQVGVLRFAAQRPGLSQQELASELGVLPSKVVALVDELEARGLLERRRGTTDRRQYALHLTESGEPELAKIRAVVRDHDREVTEPLTPEETKQLAALLAKVASAQGLTAGVHPGYRSGRGRPPTG
jgi:DNA-binding MarR family transcriptional regulator